MKPETAQKLLDENRRLYDLIAGEFSRTREHKWQELLPLGEHVKDNARILDVGCGGGRLYEIFKNRNIEYFGIDSSAPMIEICRKKWSDRAMAKFEVGDLLAIPFPSAYFDAVYSIAALHHIPSRELRLKALSEIYRLLKPGGKFIMTNWYWWSSGLGILIIIKYWLKKLFYALLNYSHILKNMRIEAELDFGDIFVPWGKRGLRYYHSFRKRELEKLLKDAGFKNIKQVVGRGTEAINSHASRPKAGLPETSGRRTGAGHWNKRVNLITIAQK